MSTTRLSRILLLTSVGLLLIGLGVYGAARAGWIGSDQVAVPIIARGLYLLVAIPVVQLVGVFVSALTKRDWRIAIVTFLAVVTIAINIVWLHR